MRISVIIPTYNRPQALKKALRSLQEQTLPVFEILVVDNATEPAVEQMVVEFNSSARVPGRYIPEPNLGLHNARHTGAHAAQGDILVFTDDDATFDAEWLRAYAEAFSQHPEMAAAGGSVLPVWEAPAPLWLLEYLEEFEVFPILSLIELPREFALDQKGYFLGVNMAIRRKVLFQVGGFNPDSFGDIWLGDGEVGLYRKLWKRGMPIGYVHKAKVYHHIPPSRMTVQYFCQRMANEGACTEYGEFHEKVPGESRLLLRMAHIILQLLKQGVINAKKMVFRQERFAWLKLKMATAYNLSRLRYIFRLATDAQFRKMVSKKDWLTEKL